MNRSVLRSGIALVAATAAMLTFTLSTSGIARADDEIPSVTPVVSTDAGGGQSSPDSATESASPAEAIPDEAPVAADDSPAAVGASPVPTDDSGTSPASEDPPSVDPGTTDTPTGEPGTSDTPTGEPATADTPTGEPAAGDSSTTPSEDSSTSASTKDTPTGEPGTSDTSTGEPAAGDSSTTPEDSSTSASTKDTPTGEPGTSDTPTGQPGTSDTPTTTPSILTPVTSPSEQPTTTCTVKDEPTTTPSIITPVTSPSEKPSTTSTPPGLFGGDQPTCSVSDVVLASVVFGTGPLTVKAEFAPTTPIDVGWATPVTLTLTLTAVPDAVTNVNASIDTVLPAGLVPLATSATSTTCLDATAAGATLSVSGQTVTTSGVSLAPGASCAIVVSVDASHASAGTYSTVNVATTFGAVIGGAVDLVVEPGTELTVQNPPRLQATTTSLMPANGTAAPGESLVYYFDITNTGTTGTATNVAVSGMDVSNVSCTPTPTNLAPGATEHCQLTYTIPLTALNGAFGLPITITASGYTTTAGLSGGIVRDSTVTIQGPPVKFAKAFSASSVHLGDTVDMTFTAFITDNGKVWWGFSESMPAGLTIVPQAGGQWFTTGGTCEGVQQQAVTTVGTPSASNLVFTVTPPNGRCVLTVTVKVLVTAVGNFANGDPTVCGTYSGYTSGTVTDIYFVGTYKGDYGLNAFWGWIGGASCPTITSDAGSLALSKTATYWDAGGNQLPSAPGEGGIIRYALTVTNKTNSTLSDVWIADPAGYTDMAVPGFSGTGATFTNVSAGCTYDPAKGFMISPTVGPNASYTCTADYVVTKADVDAGGVYNTAMAHATVQGTTVKLVSPPEYWNVAMSAAMYIKKTAESVTSSGGVSRTPLEVKAADDLVRYRITVFNGGNTALHGVQVSDTGPVPGTGVHTFLGCKYDIGDTVSWYPSYAEWNAASASPVLGAMDLGVNQYLTCYAEYTATQADLEAAETLVNTATAKAGSLNATPWATEANVARVPVVPDATYTLVKKALATTTMAPIDKAKPDDSITYSFTIKNTGTVSLHSVNLVDGSFTGLDAGGSPVAAPQVDEAVLCDRTHKNGTVDTVQYSVLTSVAGGLAPGDEVTCYSTAYVVSSGDGDAALAAIPNQYWISDTLSASAQFGTAHKPAHYDADNSNPDAAVEIIVPRLELTKTATVNGATVPTAQITKSGDVVAYTITAKNTGTAPAENVAVTDVGPTWNVTGSGTGSWTTPLTCTPAVPVASLAPGDAITCTGTYTVDPLDPGVKGLQPGTKGTLDNTATASATGIDPMDKPVSIPVVAAEPKLSITKTATVNGAAVPSAQITKKGDVVAYTITVTNNGATDALNVNVTDPGPTVFTGITGTPTLPLVCTPAVPVATLAAGASITCQGLFTVDGLDAGTKGTLTNTATVSAIDMTDKTAHADVPVASAEPKLSITKTATVNGAAVPTAKVTAVHDVVTYTITVKNEGATNALNVVVADPGPAFVPAALIPPDPVTGTWALVCQQWTAAPAPAVNTFTLASLLAGESVTCTATYTVDTLAAGTKGSLDNTATLTATDMTDKKAQAQVPVAAGEPNLSITKTATVNGAAVPTAQITKKGDVVAYTITVTNNGATDALNVNVTDPGPTVFTGITGTPTLPLVCTPAVPVATLAAGASITCQGLFTVDGLDAGTKGTLTNTATVSATDMTDKTAHANVPVVAAEPKLSITKTADSVTHNPAIAGAPTDTVIAARDVVTYTITVKNEGATNALNVVVADPGPEWMTAVGDGTWALVCLQWTAAPAPAVDTFTLASLLAGESVTCTATYTVDTLAAGTKGSLDNTATLKATDMDPMTDDASVPVAALEPDLSITKEVTSIVHGPTVAATPTDDISKTVVAEGDVIHYLITVTNNGDTDALNVTVTDSGPTAFTGITGTWDMAACGPVTVPAHEWVECGATFTVDTLTPGATGSLDNTATVSANYMDDHTSEPAKVPVMAPKIEVDKTVTSVVPAGSTTPRSPMTVMAEGDVVTYDIPVTNSGAIDLYGVEVKDLGPVPTNPSGWTLTCPGGTAGTDASGDSIVIIDTLPANATKDYTIHCTGTYTVTTADLAGNKLTNHVWVSAHDPADVADDAMADVPENAPVDLTITKDVPPFYTASSPQGDPPITWTITVTNNGPGTALTGWTVADTFTAGGTELDFGNKVPVFRVTPAGAATCVFYGLSANNPTLICTGNVDLAPDATVTIEMDMPTVPSAKLCIDNKAEVATATGATDSVDNNTDNNTALAETCLGMLAVDKSVVSETSSVDPITFEKVGELLTYTITVTNTTHNTNLTNVKLTDSIPDDSPTVPGLTWLNAGLCTVNSTGATVPVAGPWDLKAGDTITCTATYKVAQADMDNGCVTNTATVTGDVKKGNTYIPVPPVSDDATACAKSQAPALTLTKTPTVTRNGTDITNDIVAGPDSVRLGDVITYKVVATNTGNVTLKDVAVTEMSFTANGGMLPDWAGACTPTSHSNGGTPETFTLAPDDTITCTTVGYTVTQDDIDLAMIETDPDLHNAIVNKAEATATFKGADLTADATSKLPLAVEGPSVYVQKDVDSVTTNGVAQTLPYRAKAGDVIRFAVTVENNGTTTVHAVTLNELITDPAGLGRVFTGSGTPSAIGSCQYGATNTTHTRALYPTPANSAITLAPGEFATCYVTYTVTQIDIDRANDIVNWAEGTALGPDNQPVEPSADDATEPVEPGTSQLNLTKVLSAAVDKNKQPLDPAVVLDAKIRGAKVGDFLTFTLKATNTGTGTVSGVTVSDTGFTGLGTPPVVSGCSAAKADGTPIAAEGDGTYILPPGGVLTCIATYTVVQADVDLGKPFINSMTATGTEEIGPPDDPVIPPEPAAGDLTILKTADQTALVKGETITYTFKVTNTGNVTVTNLAIVEDKFSGSGILSAIDCGGVTTLAPGEFHICTAIYLVTQADVDAGTVSNTAHAAGLNPAGNGVTSKPWTAVVPGAAAGSMKVEKSADVTTAKAGDTITYSFKVTNTGGVTITNLTIVETVFSGTGTLSAVDCGGVTTLAPGQVHTCTATYVVTDADVAQGAALNNTALASGLDPQKKTVKSEGSTVSVGLTRVVPPAPPTAAPIAGTGGFVGAGVSPAVGLLALLLALTGAMTGVAALRRRQA